MLRLDLHIHTRYSKDSTAPIPAMVTYGDAHSAPGLARTYNEVPNFDGTLEGLSQAAGTGRMSDHAPNPIRLLAPGLAKSHIVPR